MQKSSCGVEKKTFFAPTVGGCNDYLDYSSENKSYTHMPFYSALNRAENDVEWQLSFRKLGEDAWIIDYPLPTQPGISGGALMVDDVIIGNTNILCFIQCDFMILLFFDEGFILRKKKQELVTERCLRKNRKVVLQKHIRNGTQLLGNFLQLMFE